MGGIGADSICGRGADVESLRDALAPELVAEADYRLIGAYERRFRLGGVEEQDPAAVDGDGPLLAQPVDMALTDIRIPLQRCQPLDVGSLRLPSRRVVLEIGLLQGGLLGCLATPARKATNRNM